MIQKIFLNTMIDPVLTGSDFILNSCLIQFLKYFGEKVYCLILRHLLNVDCTLRIWLFLICNRRHLLVISFSSLLLRVEILSIIIKLWLFIRSLLSYVCLKIPIILIINIFQICLILKLIITAKCILIFILCSYHFYCVS